ncbi:malate dehydrogenase, cytoplasmic-like [Scyliorhinus torazame]|uniref:malate dehydrogenase, cytoplasmic-like n=1 Tax=Scyliorhinus torazame TaxID=75743 RepID=UPI003B5AF371
MQGAGSRSERGGAAMEEPVKVVVTGAAGPTAYSLLYSMASGAVFGGEQPLALVLMDVPSMLGVLSGVAMELQDCALQLLQVSLALSLSPSPQGFQQQATTLMGGGRPPGAMSTANAIGDHLRALWSGTQEGDYVSMGVLSNGNSYGVPDQLIYAFPVTVQERRWKMVRGLSVSEVSRRRMAQSAWELHGERERALRGLAKSNL